MRSRACLIVVVTGLLSLPGCGQVSMAPVTGKVTCNGKPVANAAIVFSPVPKKDGDRESGKPATGYTDADGKYTLSTFKNYDGAMVGQHRVTVSLEDTNPAPTQRKNELPTPFEVKPGDNDLPIDLPKR
jgi:hypothetical protein